MFISEVVLDAAMYHEQMYSVNKSSVAWRFDRKGFERYAAKARQRARKGIRSIEEGGRICCLKTEVQRSHLMSETLMLG